MVGAAEASWFRDRVVSESSRSTLFRRSLQQARLRLCLLSGWRLADRAESFP
jgi:hypothetical protein